MKTLTDADAGTVKLKPKADDDPWPSSPSSASASRRDTQQGSRDHHVPHTCGAAQDEGRGRRRHPPRRRPARVAQADDDRRVSVAELHPWRNHGCPSQDAQGALPARSRLRCPHALELHRPQRQGDHHRGRFLRRAPRADRGRPQRDRASSRPRLHPSELQESDIGARSPPAPVPVPAPRRRNCDPSYPTVCIPPPPPDLNCADVPFTGFKVIPPDPHHFDGDKDGVGCES